MIGSKNRIDVYALTGTKPAASISWLPYHGQDWTKRDCAFAAFADDEQVVTLGTEGRLIRWRLKGVQAVQSLELEAGAVAAISANHKQLAVVSSASGAAILDPSTFKTLGRLSGDVRGIRSVDNTFRVGYYGYQPVLVYGMEYPPRAGSYFLSLSDSITAPDSLYYSYYDAVYVDDLDSIVVDALRLVFPDSGVSGYGMRRVSCLATRSRCATRASPGSPATRSISMEDVARSTIASSRAAARRAVRAAG